MLVHEISELAAQAGNLALSRQKALSELSVTAKGHLDFVTDVDRAVEEMIAAGIGRLFPDDGILGEEGRSLSGISGRTWIIDPIDGTHNFVRGGSSWAVSIGLASDRPVAAALNAPVEGTMLVAEAGKGIWRNGEKLPAHRRPAEPSIAYTGVSTWMSTDNDRWLSGFVRDELGLADRRTGSAVTGLIPVILGEADLYIGFGEHIWDVAGAAIIAAEAGCAHSLDWSAGLPQGPFTFVCGEPALVERTSRALEMRRT
ncbi:inositol monophosphatase family protein [Rhizobium sp. P32RR-XVIII]|uniref:inositol monophosphatase family protein n=1 Tax=Rhizobium sp. P32RR-XVIII TaxID=2726738 RepID=UPI00145651DA|nr:inositol monophosphatase family protein [Rhizobium sp. P32RR-XVIII]NLS06142.1 inositol monophosphatase family protein [Rhizobium sp. P32RR-XVIII]